MGVVDDFYNLNWKIKLILQLLFVGSPIVTLEFYINIESILNLQLNNYLNIFSTVIWVILLMNSINFTDNMDGFAGLNTSFICLALGIISFSINQNYLADLSIVLLFSILGFLLLNYPPAKIYMGDSGSLFIGYVLGFISIIFDWNPISDGSIYDSFAPVLLFFTIPLLDFTTVFTYRIRNRISPTIGGTDHISHRLLKQGFSVQKILFIFFCINFVVFAILSASIIFNELTIYFIFLYLIFVIYLFLKFSKMEILD
jgi:UDP-GlcNAc:undecaprenyl-phosphate GlcNAc-1-phosphate transferase